jgi:hypothetical protein
MILPGLLFDFEDGRDMLLRNELSPSYRVLQPKKKNLILHSDLRENPKSNIYAIYAIFIILLKDGAKCNDHSNDNGFLR